MTEAAAAEECEMKLWNKLLRQVLPVLPLLWLLPFTDFHLLHP